MLRRVLQSAQKFATPIFLVAQETLNDIRRFIIIHQISALLMGSDILRGVIL